ncbi:MAG: outer membrane protein assembly factor BamD [Nitrospira sp.]|nr:outer membrane protein assembly factor BamD [Nitrospira sp.]
MKLILLILVAAVSLSTGCSSTKKQTTETAKSVSGTDEQIFIGDTVEKNYDPNVIIKRAEAFFEKEDYPEAIIEYQHFLDLHRVHVLASYAQFKLGESHYKMAKTVDRDLAPVFKAQEAYEKLLKEFPGSRYEQEAAERIRGCHALVAQHYLLVGQFYYRRESYLAAAYRFESILKNYPEMDVVPEAQYYLAAAYSELGAKDWALEQLTLLAEKYPTHKHQEDARKLFAKLGGTQPAGTMLAHARPASNATASIAPPQVPAIDAQPTGRPLVLSASTPATALVPLNAVATQAASIVSSAAPSAATSLLPQMTLCRLGSWC